MNNSYQCDLLVLLLASFCSESVFGMGREKVGIARTRGTRSWGREDEGNWIVRSQGRGGRDREDTEFNTLPSTDPMSPATPTHHTYTPHSQSSTKLCMCVRVYVCMCACADHIWKIITHFKNILVPVRCKICAHERSPGRSTITTTITNWLRTGVNRWLKCTPARADKHIDSSLEMFILFT